MKIRLGSRTIKLNRVSKVTNAGVHLAKITFVTGESILVKCGVNFLDRNGFTYPGTVAELKAFIAEFIG